MLRSSTSEQSPLCSDVFLCLWQKKDVIRPLPCSSFPNRTRCAGLRFGFGRKPGGIGIYSVAIFQLVASGISLAASFFISLQSSSRAHAAANSRNCTRTGRYGYSHGAAGESAYPAETDSACAEVFAAEPFHPFFPPDRIKQLQNGRDSSMIAGNLPQKGGTFLAYHI